MIFTEGDRKLIDEVAELWVESGGDDEGLDWVYADLKEAIRDEMKEKEENEKENTG